VFHLYKPHIGYQSNKQTGLSGLLHQYEHFSIAKMNAKFMSTKEEWLAILCYDSSSFWSNVFQGFKQTFTMCL